MKPIQKWQKLENKQHQLTTKNKQLLRPVFHKPKHSTILTVFDNPTKKPIMKPAVPPVVIPPQWFIPENLVDYGSDSDISGDSELSDRLSVISSINGQFDGYHYTSQSSGFFLESRLSTRTMPSKAELSDKGDAKLEKIKKFQFKAIITVTMIIINLIPLRKHMLNIHLKKLMSHNL